jgi:hypothetical protein
VPAELPSFFFENLQQGKPRCGNSLILISL